MSTVPKLGTKPYERLAWRVIEDATRGAKKGNVEDILWLLTEGVCWLEGLGVDGKAYVSQIVNEAQKRTDFDLISTMIEGGMLQWQMR